MTHTELLGEMGNYELSIEPIQFRSILSRYSHLLVVRENGSKIDAHNALYLSLEQESGLSQSDNHLSWYRSGVCHVSSEGQVTTHDMTFTEWMYSMLGHVRHALTSEF